MTTKGIERPEMWNPVEAGGTIYPSQKAAAEALGVSPAAISMALKRHGHLNNIGNPCPWGSAKPCEVFGVKFRSRHEAEQALNVNCQTLRRFLNGNTQERGRENMRRAVERYKESINA